jgi:hypothetical protein
LTLIVSSASSVLAFKKFAGARGFLVVNCAMIKRASLVAVGCLALCFPAVAQQTRPLGQNVSLQQLGFYQPDLLRSVDSSTLITDLSLVAAFGGQLPISNSLAPMAMMPGNPFPNVPLSMAQVQRLPAPTDGKDLPSEPLISRLSRYQFSGEAGLLYGHATGKYGGDLFQSYIQGGVGDDHFQISVGAAYEEWNGRGFRTWSR